MINARDNDGHTPLFSVFNPTFSRNSDSMSASVKLLIKNGADINARDSSKKTILHYCSLWFSSPINQDNDEFCAEVVTDLLRCGANHKICDDKDLSPYYYAKLNKLSKTTAVFKNAGYKTKSDDIKVRQYLAEKRKKDAKKNTADDVYAGISMIGIPFTYLGYSIYAREYQYKDNYTSNNLRPKNNYMTGLMLGTYSGVLLGWLVREASPGSSGMFIETRDLYPLFGMVAGGIAGHFIGRGFQRQKSNAPFIYYGAPVGLAITLPLIFFTNSDRLRY